MYRGYTPGYYPLTKYPEPLSTLPKTNISPLKMGAETQKQTIVFQPSIFRCEHVSFTGVYRKKVPKSKIHGFWTQK